MEVPRCPDPAHVGGRVVRAGWYGRPPHRRPRWLCRAAGREHARMTGPGGRLRDPNLDGQLVANWVDSLAAIVTAGELPQRWPERLALDSREFRIDRGPSRTPAAPPRRPPRPALPAHLTHIHPDRVGTCVRHAAQWPLPRWIRGRRGPLLDQGEQRRPVLVLRVRARPA